MGHPIPRAAGSCLTTSPFPACKLWEKTSAAGRRYLTGRLGGVRVLVMENAYPVAGDDSTHTLMFAAAAPWAAAPGRAEPPPLVDPDDPATPPAAASAPRQAAPAKAAGPARQGTRRGKAEPRQQLDSDPVPF
jgi:hypothetical protein